nr:uncharacterized protein LOC122273230 [Parasteatoda tepidariorum]
MNTRTELITKSATEMVLSPDDCYIDANAKSHSEGRLSKADSVNDLHITSVVENDLSHVFCYDAVLENVSPETPTEHPFTNEPTSDAKFTRPTHSFPDDSLNINTTYEMVSSPGVSYKDTVKKPASEGKGSKADARLTDNSENYLKILSSKGGDLSQNVSCSKISPSKTNAYELPMECHFINACASEVEYTIATISHPDGNFNRCTTSELNPESAKVISSSGSSYNDALEKSSLDGQGMNADPGSFDNSVNNLEIESAIDRDLSLDASCDQVSEKICSERDVSGLPVQYDSSITSESDAEVTTKASNFVPEIKYDEVVVISSPKGKGAYSDETPLKSDTIIATASSVTLGKGLDFLPVLSRKEISKRSSTSRISKTKVLKNVILDLKNVSKQIHKTIEKISSLSTCAKCGAPLQRICKSKTCLEPTENAGDMAIQLQTVSKSIILGLFIIS